MRRISKHVCAGALAFFLLAACTGSGTDERPPHPNVLIILTDDQRLAGTMEVMPKTDEWFGAGGTTFPNAYVTTPVCCPSRASILSGQYVHNHGVRTNDDADRLEPDHLLQAELGDAGYRTAIVGKYLVRPGPYDDPEAVGIDPPGFDDWRIFLGGYRTTLFNVDGEMQRVDEYATRYIASESEDLLDDFEEEDGQPWFLYVAPFAPHYPWVAATRYKEAVVPEWQRPPTVQNPTAADKPDWVRRSRIPGSRSEKARNHQLRTLMSVDDLVDHVLSKVEALDEGRDTIVFFLSDNGYHWGEHGLGEKSSPYLESVRVPFLVRWPEEYKVRPVDPRIVANIDVAPTIYEAAGIEVSDLDGRSILTPGKRDALLLEHWKEAELNLKVPAWTSLVTGAMQYIRTPQEDGVFEELYDLRSDPFQQRNLASRPAARSILKRMRRSLAAASTCRGADCP
jgi:arylsulfatase A-like enzyme